MKHVHFWHNRWCAFRTGLFRHRNHTLQLWVTQMNYWIGSLKLTNGIWSNESCYIQILSRDSSNKQCLPLTGSSFGLNQLGPKRRECVIPWTSNSVSLFASHNDEVTSEESDGDDKSANMWNTHTYACPPTGTSLEEAETSSVKKSVHEHPVHLCGDCSKLAVCVCVCCTWCWDSSRLPLAHSESPRRCRILASSSRRPSCSARRRPETHGNRDLPINAFPGSVLNE